MYSGVGRRGLHICATGKNVQMLGQWFLFLRSYSRRHCSLGQRPGTGGSVGCGGFQPHDLARNSS